MDQERFDIDCKDNRILVNTRIDGHLKSDKSIWLEGAILGDVHCDKQVIVNKGALIDGDVECEELYVNGEITGNVCATCKTVMGANAVVKGNLVTASLEITPGAKIGIGLKLKNASK